jgi:hypothetical protein
LITAIALLVPGAAAFAQTAPQLLPYTAKRIAGGGATAIPATVGATCPISGNHTTDIYGDGCLGTEIQLAISGTTAGGGRDAVADVNGNVFFSDYINGLVRRVDALTGVVTAVAGGPATSPAASATCGALTSTDVKGDGCLSTAVHLSHPAGLVLDPSGNLYFSDIGYAEVREIAATSGLIPVTGGVISLVAGNVAGTFGWTSGVNAATASYLQDPYGLAFDNAGNLYIADEYTHAESVVVVNTTSSSTTVTGVTIPAGQMVKIVGSPTGGGSTCPLSPPAASASGGCNFGNYTVGAVANASQVDGPYAVGVDPSGNVYIANEFNDNGVKVSSAGLISTYGGIQASVSKPVATTRGAQGSFGMGSPFGVAVDGNSNVYLTDASSGYIWRIDASGSMYVVGGGAATVCTGATDTNGDGCPARQATFGHSGTTFASTTAPGPGLWGISVDGFSNLYMADTETTLIREIASGTQFGPVGASGATQSVDIHFATNDSPSASAYTISASSTAGIFTLGTAVCTNNSDLTEDCVLPITVVPTALGTFTGTLTVTSTLGTTANFPLSGTYVNTPQTRTTLTAVSTGTVCTGTTTYSTTTPITLTATIAASSTTLTGTVTFFANSTQIGSPVTVSHNQAVLTQTFTTAGTYALTATYSGDGVFYTGSTTASSTNITSSAPTFTIAALPYATETSCVIGGVTVIPCVTPGQTALFSGNIVQNVYSGTITFSCSGLPAGATCLFNPSTITATGCSTTNTVALSVITQQHLPATSGFILPGKGKWTLLSMLPVLALALLIAVRRKQTKGLRASGLLIALIALFAMAGTTGCGNGVNVAASPAGVYTVTVNAVGSTGTTSSIHFTLGVN